MNGCFFAHGGSAFPDWPPPFTYSLPDVPRWQRVVADQIGLGEWTDAFVDRDLTGGDEVWFRVCGPMWDAALKRAEKRRREAAREARERSTPRLFAAVETRETT